MADMTFNTTAGQTVDRELLIAYLNTGETGTPTWSPLGTRVTDSSMEYDWQEDSSKDILGTTRTTMKKPIITQTFDPSNLDAGDPAIVKVWNLAVKEQNAAALANQDVLIVHAYAGTAKTAVFAERYSSCMGQALFPRRRGWRLYRYAYRRDAWRRAHCRHCRYLWQHGYFYRGRITNRGLASVSPHFGGIYGTHF